jgi:hypothetical protein
VLSPTLVCFSDSLLLPLLNNPLSQVPIGQHGNNANNVANDANAGNGANGAAGAAACNAAKRQLLTKAQTANKALQRVAAAAQK